MWGKLSSLQRFLLILISIPVVIFLLFKLFANDKYLQIKRGMDVKRLESTLLFLQENKVTAYRFQEGCKLLEYKGVSYAYVHPSWETKETCIYPLSNEPIEFNKEANDLFWEIKSRLGKSGVNIFLIDYIVYSRDRISSAEFNISTFMARNRYIYQPGHTITEYTTDNANFWNYPVNQDWYFQSEDWN